MDCACLCGINGKFPAWQSVSYPLYVRMEGCRGAGLVGVMYLVRVTALPAPLSPPHRAQDPREAPHVCMHFLPKLDISFFPPPPLTCSFSPKILDSSRQTNEFLSSIRRTRVGNWIGSTPACELKRNKNNEKIVRSLLTARALRRRGAPRSTGGGGGDECKQMISQPRQGW